MTELSVQIEKQIAEFKPFEAELAEFKKRYDGVVYDLDDAKQEKQARSDQYAIGKVVSKLDQKHKDIKAPLAELVKLVDGKRKEIKDDLQNVQAKIKNQIKQHEDKKAEHEAKLKEQFDYIKTFSVFDGWSPNSKDIKTNLDLAKGHIVDESFEHYQEEAEFELKSQIEKLTAMYESSIKSEAEAAELEKLRKEAAEREAKERDERLKAEAAEQARIEAEQKAKAELERVEAEKQKAIIDAENAKKEAERKAQQAVIDERLRVEREAAEKAAKEQAEREKEEKRKAQKKHISKVLTQIKNSFMDAGYKEPEAKKITELIRDNKISNVQVNW